LAISVGLSGYGLSGAIFHAPIIEKVQGLELTTVMSSDPAKVRRDYPHVAVVPSLDGLLADKDIALVVIATPNDTHYEFAKRALEAGKHVIVEKPFTLNVARADDLIELARERRLMLSVYQNRRWDNDFLTISQLLKTGLLGDISTYEAHFDRYRPLVKDRWRERAIPGAGTLYDLGSHLIDQALCLFGVPASVWAEVEAQRQGAQTDDYFHLVLDYPALRVILHSGSLVREPGPHFQIHGSKGSFIKYGLDSQEDALKAGRRPGDPGWGEDNASAYGDLTTDVGELTLQGKVRTLPGHYEAFYEGVVAALTEGKAAPVAATDARNTIRVIECALQSSRERRAIAF
jgi:scyllo-inositol 2-dehydrogenase (NADP+)